MAPFEHRQRDLGGQRHEGMVRLPEVVCREHTDLVTFWRGHARLAAEVAHLEDQIRINLVGINTVADRHDALWLGIDSGLLANFSDNGGLERLAVVDLAAGKHEFAPMAAVGEAYEQDPARDAHDAPNADHGARHGRLGHLISE